MREDGDPRRSRSLDGEWLFDVDPDAVGMSAGWGTEPAIWVTEANPVDVPHVWQETDDLRGYAGTAWYHRSFDLEEGALDSRRAFLEFGAVDYWATVWVDGERVGDHRGGYLPFEFEVTEALGAGENTVTVAVHDPEDLREIPHGNQGEPWYTRVSGIWQSVSLSLRPESHVVDARVTPDLESDTATVSLEVDPGGRDGEDLRAIVRATRGGSVAALASAGPEGSVTLEFDDPDYWSPDAPALYDLEVTLRAGRAVVDRYADTFGMRALERDGAGGLLLNGEPIRLRGVVDRGYYPETLYRPPAGWSAEREVERIRDLGFNLVRTQGKPARPDFLEAADRQGLLVWAEPAGPTRYTDRSREATEEELFGLIDRDYNRPSVVLWGVYDEERGIGHDPAEEPLWTDEAKQAALASTVDAVRERDPTRLVCDNSGWAHVDTDLNDYHRYVASPDRATEWSGALEHLLHHRGDNYATRRWAEPDAPVVISEFGCWALPDVEALAEHYGREPPWFAGEFPAEARKRPSDVEARFERTGLESVFGSLDALRKAWERRALDSLSHAIGEFRRREEVSGYVLTQLTDVEWEANGLLDYRRAPKGFTDRLAAINREVALVATVDSHVAWGGRSRRLELALVNDTDSEVAREFEWRFGEAEGTCRLTAPAHSVAESDPIALPVPALEEPRTEPVVVEDGAGGDLACEEPITVVPSSLPVPREPVVYAEGGLAAALSRAGVSVTHRLEGADVAFTSDAGEVREFVERGGAAIQIPRDDGGMADSDCFEFRELARTDGRASTASFFYQDSPLLDGLSPEARLGWEFEDAYPYAVVSEPDPDEDVVHAGHVRGWLADWGGSLVERPVGDGRLIACTFRGEVGTHPVVTALTLGLISHLAGAD
ncbi:sugar-binding domain-containing protein [Saliphagus sp. LR7]|uniref:sugar-binding domain-containing protein n=1 Tax=Saliphagus sp. LR7 TaxID=2282654 RepID=UPI000DF78847|nr:sugar-binding domain-containing protein [Saliphagus sp. LR7]